eukprot:m.455923 g.455923  ORF g.455923 m.455923 type:complete len:423 (+) comp20964_c0_seq1:29-1297(+)
MPPGSASARKGSKADKIKLPGSASKESGRPGKRPKVPSVTAEISAQTEYSLDGLEERLARLSTYVNKRLTLIPPEHYLNKTAEEEVEQVGRYAYNKKESAPKQEVKEASKKAKRLRLDPDAAAAWSVPEIQAELASGVDAAARDDAGTTEPTGAGEAMEEGAPKPLVGGTVPRNVLHERLVARIVQLRGKRKAKEQLEREAPAGGAKKSKKQKAKQLAEELAKKKATNRDPSNAGLRGVNGVAAPTADQSGIVFSKFDFSTAQRVNAKKKKGSATPMQMLAKAKSERERLAKLKSEDPEKAEQLETKNKWKTVLLKATGTKVKDDEKLLKRTMKRKESAKKRTQKEWGERTSIVKKFQDAKQAKRKENIKARSAAKIERKITGKKATKAKVTKKRPGFEGGTTPPKKAAKERMTLQTGYKKK